MRSTNPVLRNIGQEATYISDRPVTYTNVTTKTLFLVALVALSAYLSLYFGLVSYGTLIGAFIVGFIAVIVGTRSVRLAPYFAIVYSLAEGMILGVVSLLFAAEYQGIVQTALLSTLLVLVIMMLLYSTRIIKVTQGFASIIVIALIALIFMSFLNIFLQFNTSFFYLIVIISSALSALFLL
ncbi:MAG TPA: Bax inhibitor-1/YccA family protein, partial [Bacillota bacterium]|nr:Bax inhibitor-1/YccA family protein [Bacillota bacterium]